MFGMGQDWHDLEDSRKVVLSEEEAEFATELRCIWGEACNDHCFGHYDNSFLICRRCGQCASRHVLLEQEDWGPVGRICSDRLHLLSDHVLPAFEVTRLY